MKAMARSKIGPKQPVCTSRTIVTALRVPGGFSIEWAPDLYVANDFGRSNLYRNNGDGTSTRFPPMHTSTMPAQEWVRAGSILTTTGNKTSTLRTCGRQVCAFPINPPFIKRSGNIRSFYRHAVAILYRKLGDAKFQNVSESAGAGMGRWAWSSDVCDFDHDGYPTSGERVWLSS
jgi:hypothetical protein